MQCKCYANSWYTILLGEQWHVHYGCNFISYLWSTLHMWYLNMQRDDCINLNYCSFIYNTILRNLENCLQTGEVGDTDSDLMVLVCLQAASTPILFSQLNKHRSITCTSYAVTPRCFFVCLFYYGKPSYLAVNGWDANTLGLDWGM